MFVDHPILGVGSRRFEEYKFDYGDISREHWDLNSHNTYVEIVSGSGLAGLLTFLGFSVSLIRALRRENFLDEHPVLEHARLATLIALYSMLFRAFFDAKMHEWGIYTLCIIGVCVLALGKTMQDERDVSALRTGAA
jgi:O-antigen ligase